MDTTVVTEAARFYRDPRPILPWVERLAIIAVGLEIAAQTLGPNNVATAIIGFIALPVDLAMVIAALLFFHRLSTNLDAFGRTDRRWRRPWSVIAWIIPLVQWILPLFVVRELWRGSDPTFPEGTGRWQYATVPTKLFAVWWSTWAIANALGLVFAIGGSFTDIEQGLPPWLRATGIIAMLLLIVALFPFLNIVRHLAARQVAAADAYRIRREKRDDE